MILIKCDAAWQTALPFIAENHPLTVLMVTFEGAYKDLGNLAANSFQIAVF